jgi:hypothetical protein
MCNTVIESGDHIIVLLNGNVSSNDAEQIRISMLETLPALSNVSVITNCNGLAVYRSSENVRPTGFLSR